MKPLKRIHHYLQQRYGAMWSLLLFAMVMLGLIVIQVFGWSANWHSPDADKYLGWMYACNLGCLLVISVQLLRLDCRRLLSRRTAEILNTCGSAIFILMFIRNRLDDHVTSVDLHAAPFYAEDSSFIYLLCLLLFFCASMVFRLDVPDVDDSRNYLSVAHLASFPERRWWTERRRHSYIDGMAIRQHVSVEQSRQTPHPLARNHRRQTT